jgi:hypothetical protein
MNVEKFRTAAALAALLAAGGPAAAGPVCIDPIDPQCAKLSDDPQPTAGDAAPGMLDGSLAAPGSGGAPILRARPPAAAAAPMIAPDPAPPPPPPPEGKEPLEPGDDAPQ